MYHHAGQVIKYIQLAMIGSCRLKQMQSKPYEMGGKSVLSIGEEKLDQEHWLPWTVLDTMRQGPRWVGSFPLHEGEELLGLCVFLFFELTFRYTENIARLCDLQAQ